MESLYQILKNRIGSVEILTTPMFQQIVADGLREYFQQTIGIILEEDASGDLLQLSINGFIFPLNRKSARQFLSQNPLLCDYTTTAHKAKQELLGNESSKYHFHNGIRASTTLFYRDRETLDAYVRRFLVPKK